MLDRHPLPGTDVVVDGLRMHVVAHGRAGATDLPLLLLHGLPTSSYLWRDVMRDLHHDVRTIAPDLIGLGRSERPPRGTSAPYTLTGQAQRLVGLLDHLGIDRVLVAGHVLGGAVAVQLAALAPERVAGLVLLGAPVHADAWPVPAVLPLLLPGGGAVYVRGLSRSPALAAKVLARGLGSTGRLGRGELDHYLAPLLTPDGARGLVALVRAVDLAETESAWRLLRAAPPPTLVLWGENDSVHSVAYGRRVVGELPGAAWVPLTDTGHLVPLERPERLAEELAAFAGELAGRPAADVRSAERQSADQ